MRETQIENYFVKRVKELGGWQRKFTSPNCKGVPDRVVKMPAWTCPVFVEFKATGQGVRSDQKREHTRMQAVGCEVLVIDTFGKVDELIW